MCGFAKKLDKGGVNMERQWFTARDGKKISLALWDKVDCPRGVVQIVHGMAEHIARYDDFAAFLNSRGYIVAGDDHRAHGLTDKDALGLQGEGDLFEKTVQDLKDITVMLKEKYNLPVFLFGHSYGSFLTQRYLSVDPNPLSGAVLCGSALMKGAAVNLGYRIAKGKLKKKADKPGNIFAALTFEKYDKKFGEGLGGWLNRDVKAVGEYNADPLCGFTCSNGFYYWFFKGLKSIAASPCEKLPPSFPLLIISGAEDMVGGCGKLVEKLKLRYQQKGLKPVVKLYMGARHEILNELSKAETYEDAADFFDTVTSK